MVATVGFKVDKTELNNVVNNISKMKQSFLGIKTAIVGAATGLFVFEAHLGKMGTQLGNTSQILQTPTDQLQAMKVAASQAAVPFSTLTGAVGGLQNALVNYRAGQGLPQNIQKGLGDLSRLTGVTLNPQSFKNGNDFFKAFANTLKLIPTTQGKEGVLNLMFGNSNLLPLISGGMDKINQAYKQLKTQGALLTPSDISKMHQFNAELGIASQQMEVMFAKAGIKLMPTFEKLFQTMNQLGNNKDFINGLKDIGNLLAWIAKYVVGLIAAFGRLNKMGSLIESLYHSAASGVDKALGIPKKGQTLQQRESYIKSAQQKQISYGMTYDPFEWVGKSIHAIGNHMASAVISAQHQAGIIPKNGNTNNTSNTNNTNNNTTNNHTTIINTHSHLEMMSSHVTGRYQ